MWRRSDTVITEFKVTATDGVVAELKESAARRNLSPAQFNRESMVVKLRDF